MFGGMEEECIRKSGKRKVDMYGRKGRPIFLGGNTFWKKMVLEGKEV